MNLAADLADRVITDHLRPACDAVLEQVERHGSVLAGQSLDPRALITAPAKVRTAWSAMQALAERYQALRMARGKANTAGLRTPKHDADGLFAAFAEPFAVNGYRPGNGRQAPRPEVPEDPVDRMRWLAGPAKALRPWLPTVDEQDAACWVIYGPLFEQRQTAAVFARGVVAGRGPALPTSAA